MRLLNFCLGPVEVAKLLFLSTHKPLPVLDNSSLLLNKTPKLVFHALDHRLDLPNLNGVFRRRFDLPRKSLLNLTLGRIALSGRNSGYCE